MAPVCQILNTPLNPCARTLPCPNTGSEAPADTRGAANEREIRLRTFEKEATIRIRKKGKTWAARKIFRENAVQSVGQFISRISMRRKADRALSVNRV